MIDWSRGLFICPLSCKVTKGSQGEYAQSADHREPHSKVSLSGLDLISPILFGVVQERVDCMLEKIDLVIRMVISILTSRKMNPSSNVFCYLSMLFFLSFSDVHGRIFIVGLSGKNLLGQNSKSIVCWINIQWKSFSAFTVLFLSSPLMRPWSSKVTVAAGRPVISLLVAIISLHDGQVPTTSYVPFLYSVHLLTYLYITVCWIAS